MDFRTLSKPHPKQVELHLKDDFEGVKIADFWLSGNYGSGRHETGAVEISTDYTRTRRSSVCITVREGDIEQRSGSGKRTERAEIDIGRFALLERQLRCRFSFLIPKDFPIVDNRLVFYQWEQVQGASIAQQHYIDGRHCVAIRKIENPYKDYPHLQYTPLGKVPDTAIKEMGLKLTAPSESFYKPDEASTSRGHTAG